MKKILLCFALLCFALLCFALPGWAAEERTLDSPRALSQRDFNVNYPTIKEMYEECKTAVDQAGSNTKEFLHSICAARMNGVFNGLYILAGIQLVDPEPKDPCYDTKKEINKELGHAICMPINTFPKNSPVELSIAKDFIAYIDSHYKADKNFTADHASKGYPAIDLIAIFSEMYRCKS